MTQPPSKASSKPIILFIDEAHTLIGAGGQAGVAKALDILGKELTTTMGLCGVNTIAEIDDKVLAV